MYVGKDGGDESSVWGLYFVEIKRLFTAALLLFTHGSREAHHSHAFNSVSWLLRGALIEHHIDGSTTVHRPRFRPILTYTDTFHRVWSQGDSWVLTFRGPWLDTWHEWVESASTLTLLTHGRRVVWTRADVSLRKLRRRWAPL